MNKIGFDVSSGEYTNAGNASIYKDYIISSLISKYQTDNPREILAACGLTYNSGGSLFLSRVGNYIRLLVTEAPVNFTIPTSYCRIHFHDRESGESSQYDYVGGGQNTSLITLPFGTYGFDELNILLNPRYLYRQNNQPYFHQINKNINEQTQNIYNMTSTVDKSDSSRIYYKYTGDIFITTPTAGQEYSMPNYRLGNYDVCSIGMSKSITGSNPFTYEGKVFGAPSNEHQKDPIPFPGAADQGCYNNEIPQIIYMRGNKIGDGESYDFDTTATSVTVHGRNTTNQATRSVRYNITNATLVKYTRDPSKATIDNDFNFTNSVFFSGHEGNSSDVDDRIGIFGYPSADVALEGTIHYTIPMTMAIGNGSDGDNTTNQVYATLIGSSKLKTPTNNPYIVNQYDNGNNIQGDGSRWSPSPYYTAIIGCCEDKRNSHTKYNTTFKFYLQATLQTLPDEQVRLPNSIKINSEDPYISSFQHATRNGESGGSEYEVDDALNADRYLADDIYTVKPRLRFRIFPHISNHSYGACFPEIVRPLKGSAQREMSFYSNPTTDYDHPEGTEATKEITFDSAKTNGFITKRGHLAGKEQTEVRSGGHPGDSRIQIDKAYYKSASGYEYYGEGGKSLQVNTTDVYFAPDSGASEKFEGLVLGRRDGYFTNDPQ